MEVSKLIEHKSNTTCWASSKRVEGSNYDKELHLSSPETLAHAVLLMNRVRTAISHAHDDQTFLRRASVPAVSGSKLD
jgi:hypothetical protein